MTEFLLRPKVLFFDLDGTLLDHNTAEVEGALAFHRHFKEEISHSENSFPARWTSIAEKTYALYFSGIIDFQEQRRRRMREIFGKTEDSLSDQEAEERFKVYLKAYEQNWTLFADVVPCLEKLGDRSVGILTNGEVGQQTQKLRQTGLVDKFKLVVCAGEVGVFKPHQGIFQEAAKRAGVPLGKCTYVGDDKGADAIASRDAGMRAIWLDRMDESGRDGVPQGIEVIRGLADLYPLLNGS
jgi:putative hydrolase of the HAD superfamily